MYASLLTFILSAVSPAAIYAVEVLGVQAYCGDRINGETAIYFDGTSLLFGGAGGAPEHGRFSCKGIDTRICTAAGNDFTLCDMITQGLTPQLQNKCVFGATEAVLSNSESVVGYRCAGICRGSKTQMTDILFLTCSEVIGRQRLRIPDVE